MGTPIELPVTIPVLDPTDARPELLLLHTPDAVASFRASVAPVQTEKLVNVAMAAGLGLTDTACSTKHPLGTV